ncbi:type VII secretion protein EssA [Streptococcus intermedius]|jgi:type VII secretion protein essA|nr:type VII secretion protein EssA [Streptococcus intermedius]MDK8091935.1 type VII secretion protein EssA [Streptococcus intermedius]
MKRKNKWFLMILICLFSTPVVFADDGELKLDTDIITNKSRKSFENNIESQYAPNLFLNRTSKVVEKKNETTTELLQVAEKKVFQSKTSSIYKLNTKKLKQGLFFNYKIESTFSISNHIKDSRKEVVGKILTTVFLLSMVILGVFLGRKWHEIRKNQSNSKI